VFIRAAGSAHGIDALPGQSQLVGGGGVSSHLAQALVSGHRSDDVRAAPGLGQSSCRSFSQAVERCVTRQAGLAALRFEPSRKTYGTEGPTVLRGQEDELIPGRRVEQDLKIGMRRAAAVLD
jgi:hypothetical protein